MPLKLQKITMLKVFNKLNPHADSYEIDWDCLDPTLTFSENREIMSNNYPQYKWTLLEDESTDQFYEKCKMDDEESEHNRLMSFGYRNDEIEERLKKYMKERYPESESFTKKFDTVWQKKETDEGTIHSTTIEIKPHTISSKGKKYTYGRIQLTVDPSWVGLKAKIEILEAKESAKPSFKTT